MKSFLLVVAVIFCAYPVFAQQDSLKATLSYTTARIEGESPRIDGKFDDPAWNQVEWGGGEFIQRMPDAGKPGSVVTKFKILYDAKNLYIAFKCYDPEPSKIVSRMSRRDGFEGDWVEINIDSYNDKRTAFSFTSSVSGVKGDEYVSNNGDFWDTSWDPIWYLKTSIDEEGWNAEVRIPLSQLRFADKPELTWGFQIQRNFFRKQEISNFQYIPPDSPGWVHLFAELKGIKGIRPQKQLEIQPYVLAKTETLEKEEGNPYMTGKSSSADVGLDAKIGITSDITLDLTVNPDFGQVEADPSQVNLTAFELFFQERRPFFIEGNNILNFPTSDFSSATLFYSRRIGRNPQGSVDTDQSGEDGVNEYVKPVNQTTILGAAKLTGKNKHGFSWGILESVTAEEKAKIDSLGYKRSMVVEPLTNYFIARAQQDINKGNTIIGGVFTATNRSINENDRHLHWLHDKAYSGGIDFIHHWKSRKFYVDFKSMFSNVQGSAEAITNTQQSSERYFQRPDNDHAFVDPARTSLTGTAGTFRIGKKSGKLVSDLGFSYLSPEFELNDLGFLAQTDNLSQWFWMQYRIINPTKIFRSQRYNINQWMEWDFDGTTTAHGYNINGHVEFKNFWAFSMGATYGERTVSNADLRGGPAIRYPGFTELWIFASTDRRKKLYFSMNPQVRNGLSGYMDAIDISTQLVYRPINALNISVAPSLSFNTHQLQYVTTGSVNNNDRYVVAQIDQTTLRISIRATYMITPNLSIQYYGQPFGTSGHYSNFKQITDGDASQYSDRFVNMSYTPGVNPRMALFDTYYVVDEDGDGEVDYEFDKPDFNFGQYRSNTVLRWEYIPGSTLFLVWTQEKNGEFYESDPRYKDYTFNFNKKTHNVFLLKFTYRFVL
jgi:hypothetical protein